uniref:Uncharacterized protein n=1 Tax=Meloidogyne hapla TaxID=6305 RepID=A0A1I8BR14_MELHA
MGRMFKTYNTNIEECIQYTVFLIFQTPSNILSQSSQSSSRQKSTPINRTINSPFSPIISSGSRSNNSSGIGSSLSSDCLDTSCFSSMGCNTQSNNWNQNSPFEMPSSSGLNNTFSEGGEASSSINSYGTVNVSMPSEQILAAALFAAAMLGSTQVPQNQNQQQNQQFQETVNNPALPIPSKRARGNNTSITISRVTTNGAAPMQAITALTNSVAKLTHPQGINLKRKGARVNGILQKYFLFHSESLNFTKSFRLSNKAAADNNNTFSPPALKMPMEIKKEELNTNTVAIKGKEELDSNPMAQKRLLVSVQTQTDNSEAEMKRFTNEKHNPSENGKAEMNGFNHQYPPKRLICCCCYDEADSFNSDEFPVGCKRRAKFFLENKEQKHYKDWNKSLSPSSPIIIKEGKEEKQSEDNNNATSISGMELFESDNDLKLEIEEEDEEENEDLGLNKCY